MIAKKKTLTALTLLTCFGLIVASCGLAADGAVDADFGDEVGSDDTLGRQPDPTVAESGGNDDASGPGDTDANSGTESGSESNPGSGSNPGSESGGGEPRDSDGDGAADDVDECPATGRSSRVNEAGCAEDQIDRDDDGSPLSQDCDDSNPEFHPGAVDLPGNGLDEDCSGAGAEFPRCQTKIVPVNPLPIQAWALQVVTGDKEFGGNTVTVSAQVESSWDDERLSLRVTFLAKEGGGDFSSGRGDSGWIQEFRVGDNERIVNVTAGGQTPPRDGIAAKLDTTDDAHGAHSVNADGLVSTWRIVADTDDDDIGGNKGDQDANVTASFRLVDVEVETQTGECLPN